MRARRRKRIVIFMPSPRPIRRSQHPMSRSTALTFCVVLLVLLGTAGRSAAQIASVTNQDGRRLFVNAEPPTLVKLAPVKPRAAIYLPGEVSFTGRNRPAMTLGRDGVEALVREAAERHRVDPAL